MKILNFSESRQSGMRRILARSVRRVLLVAALVLGVLFGSSLSDARDSDDGSDAEAYASYQRAVAARKFGKVKKAWKALAAAREQLPDVGLPLTRALLVELSVQLGEEKLQTELWDTYRLVIEHWAESVGPYADETLTLRSDYGTELVRKSEFERGHDELHALVELFEEPPAAVSLDPSPEMVHQVLVYLGLAKIRSGDLEGGVNYVERARGATPELTQMWERWLVAETLVTLERFAEALPHFSLLDGMMEESMPFGHPERVKFRRLYRTVLRKVGTPENADLMLAHWPQLDYDRLSGASKNRVATGDEPGYVAPVEIKKSNPAYPEMGMLQRIGGDCSAKVLISEKGYVVDAVIIHCDRVASVFAQELLIAVDQWQYQPATIDGVPVAVELEVNAQWRLR